VSITVCKVSKYMRCLPEVRQQKGLEKYLLVDQKPILHYGWYSIFLNKDFTYLSSFWTIQHENTTEKKKQNKTCTCVCQMCCVGSYNQVPETDEFAIAFSNHHVLCSSTTFTTLVVKRYWCVCIQTESAHCPFEKRGLHINVSFIFYFLLQAKVAAHWLNVLSNYYTWIS
jgi:hypothetical protein